MTMITITPQTFFELFVLCLSWQHDFENLKKNWTTVDKVVRILHELDILTDKQRKVLYKDRRTQHLFMSRSAKFTTAVGSNGGERREEILNSQAPLALVCDLVIDIDRQRLLRDQRIYLTRKGLAMAQAVESRYAAVIDKDKYFGVIEMWASRGDVAMGAIITAYRAKVARETSSS